MGKGIRGLVMRRVRADLGPTPKPLTTIGYTNGHNPETPIAYRCPECLSGPGVVCRGDGFGPHEARKALARPVYEKARAYQSRTGPKPRK